MTGLATPTGLLARIAGGFNAVFSAKIFVGIVLGGALMMAGLYWKAASDRDVAEKQVADIGDAVEKATGQREIKPEQIVPQIEYIAAQRESARRETERYRVIVGRQTASIRSLETQTAGAKRQSQENVEKAQVLIEQRDRWIRQAQSASTRTQWMECNTELKKTQEALDALYNAGF